MTVSEKPMLLQDEIEMIKDSRLQKAVKYCISPRQELLKIYPASIGGTYHPPEERGPGGLVLHIRRMVYMLSNLANHLGLMEIERDILLTCAFLHDISNVDLSSVDNYGKVERNHKMYSAWHGNLSAQIATTYLRLAGFEDTDEILLIIQGIIQSHMGHWYPGFRQPINNNLELIFSVVDYIDTRENVHVEL